MEHSGAKLKSLISSLLFFFSIFVIIDVSVDMIGNVSGDIIYVNTTGDGGAFTSIQDAIDASKDGDTLYVYSGTYDEHVLVNKSINLTGEDMDTTIIDGSGSGDVVRITADWVNITGFSVTGSGPTPHSYAGITLDYANYCNITNITAISNDGSGVSLKHSHDNKITDNTVSDNYMYGIYLYYSSGNNIINNKAINNRRGISLYSSGVNNIIGNSAFNNGGGIHLEHSDGNKVIGNNASSNGNDGICIWYADRNNIVGNTGSSNNWGGIQLWWANGNNITNNYFMNNANGILIVRLSNDNLITNNDVLSNNECGIHLDSTRRNNIIGNTASYNSFGVYLESTVYSSSGNNITGNTASYNEYGIHLESNAYSSSRNNIMGNQVHNNYKDGIRIQASNNNMLIVNTIFNNTLAGINITSSGYNLIHNNSVYNHSNGVYIESSSNNNLTGNNISNNGNGICHHASSNNDITNNNISNNVEGIRLSSSSNNTIYHNNIIDNINQAYDDDSTNQWNNDYPLGGNFWSDYTGIDLNSTPNQNVPPPDGIGDTPYVIDVDSQDDYPLTVPYTSRTFDNYTILKQGWNLISIPLIQYNQSLTKVLEMIDGYYDAVQWYNPVDLENPWKHHKVGKPYGNDLFELNETMGFWIHITNPGDTIFLYNGTRSSENQTITLHKGWNMVGYPSQTSYIKTDGLNNLTFGTHVDAIWYYKASSQVWDEMGESDYFIIGKGYYIHAKSECVWEVPL